MDYFILATCVCTGTAKMLVNKKVKKSVLGMEQTMLVNALSFFVALVVPICFMAFSQSLSLANPWWLTLIFATCILASQIFTMKAVELGSVAISSLFIYGNFIIPTIWGAIYYNEPVHYLQIIGIALMIISFVLGAEKEDGKKFNLKWLIYTLLAMLSSGMIGIVQKIFGKEYSSVYSLDAFLSVSFMMIVIMSLVVYLVCKIKGRVRKVHDSSRVNMSKNAIILTLILGGILGYHNKFCTYLSGALPSALYFPVLNGGAIVLVAVVSAILFKEKLNKRQLLSTAIGFISIIIISIGKLLLGN